MIKGNFLEEHLKYLGKQKLSEILAELPENSVVVVNKVGNLGVYENHSCEKFIGWIDFLFEGEFKSAYEEDDDE